MLREIHNIEQPNGEPFRRCFQSPTFDLTIWINPDGTPLGFQLAYRLGKTLKTLTWLPANGYSHNTVDEGDDVAGSYKMSDLLIPNGLFNKNQVLPQIHEEAGDLEPPLKDFLITKLNEYDSVNREDQRTL